MTADADRYERLRVGGADADRLVGELDRERFAVGLAVGDDGLDAEDAAGAQDPQGDLAAVGDEDLAEHAQRSAGSGGASRCGTGDARRLRAGRRRANSMTTSSWPYSTASPGSTRLAPTTPSARRDDLLRDAEHVDRAEPVAGPDPRPGAGAPSAAGRCRPPARWRPPALVGLARIAAVATVAASRPGPPSRRPIAVRRVPGRGASRRGRQRRDRRGRARSRARRSSRGTSPRPGGGGGPRRPSWRTSSSARPGRAELGDQRRQQLADRGGDGGVVGRALGGGPLAGGDSCGLGSDGVGHALDLLPSGRLVTRPASEPRH